MRITPHDRLSSVDGVFRVAESIWIGFRLLLRIGLVQTELGIRSEEGEMGG